MRQASHERARLFLWDAAAERYLTLFEQLALRAPKDGQQRDGETSVAVVESNHLVTKPNREH